MLEEYTEVLQKALLFRSIGKEDLPVMLGCLGPKTEVFGKDDYIVTAGETLDSIGIILEGEALVIKENAAGNRVVMTDLKEGNMFGEMLVFSNLSVWPSSVVAQKDSKVMFLQRKKITGQCEKACSWHNAVIENLLWVISERAIMLNKKVEYLTIKSMRGKICAYLLEQQKRSGNATFDLPMNRNELADFLNVSRPSMSRELARMKEEDLIDFHMSTFKIKAAGELRKMCE